MSKVLMLIFFLLLIQIAIGQSNSRAEDNCNDEIKFHYLVVWNKTSKERKINERSREVIVFLDEKAFSEDNLKLLFTHLSKKYPLPNSLDITVETNWEKIPIPNDCEGTGISEQPASKDADDYHWATFFRQGNRKFFRYNPVLKNPNIKTVVITDN
ncbi:MAG: hypothetical protein K1X72_23600 [Pyrinomonadaceae bacterium]|nr:hypothetical protein [Pyrinomonadaceae bacterium]